MATFSICRNKACSTRVDGAVTRCSACGSSMAPSTWIRQTGWLMTIVGTLIALPGVLLVVKFLPVFFDPARAVAAGRFGGTAQQVPLAMGLLLAVLAFGLALLGFGLPRALQVRRNDLAKPILLGLGVLLLVLMFYLGSQLPG